MATARRLWAGLRRWFNAEDVEPRSRPSAAMRRQLWLTLLGIPVLGGTLIRLIGDAAGWW
jgi:hypothetical protein